MLFDSFKGVGKHLQNLIVDAKGIAKGSSADTGQDCPHAYEKSLHDPQNNLQKTVSVWFHK
jgi:hypothetical protein